MTERIVIGIIGGGFGKRAILPVCLKHPQLLTKWLATENKIPTSIPTTVKTTLRWEDVADDSEVHAVIVATPHDLHAKQVAVLLTAGKHILCEKPLALDTSEAALLARRCDEAGLVGMMDYSFRFVPERNLFQELVSSGLIGHLKSLRLSFFRDDFERWPSRWYYDSSCGGGALIATGSHLIDAIHWLTQSDVRWINAVVWWENKVDVGFSVTMEMESGCICSVEVSHCIPGTGKHVIEAHGEHGSLFLASDGKITKIESGNITPFAVDDRHRFGFSERPWDGEPRLQPTARVIDMFVQCIIGSSAAVPMNFWTAVNNQMLIEAIRTSHLEKRRVEIPKSNSYKA